MIRQCHGHLIEVCQRRAPAVITGYHTESVAIGKYGQLLRWFLRGIQAHARRIAKRNGGAFHHGKQPQWIRMLAQDSSAQNLHSLAQALVRRDTQGEPALWQTKQQRCRENQHRGRDPAWQPQGAVQAGKHGAKQREHCQELQIRLRAKREQ